MHRSPVVTSFIALSISVGITSAAPAADRLADRVIDPDCYCRVYRERPMIRATPIDIGRIADLPLGFEALPDPNVDLSPRLNPDYVTYAGLTAGDALDLVIALDGNRYRWLETQGVIVVRPALAWMDTEHYLGEIRGTFAVEDASLNEVAVALQQFMDPASPVGEPTPTWVSDERLTFSIPGASLLDALIAVVKVHEGLYWEVTYRWCSTVRELWGRPGGRVPCIRDGADGDVRFVGHINAYEGKGVSFGAGVPNPVLRHESPVQWPFWPR